MIKSHLNLILLLKIMDKNGRLVNFFLFNIKFNKLMMQKIILQVRS
jgi:hypothetical protein